MFQRGRLLCAVAFALVAGDVCCAQAGATVAPFVADGLGQGTVALDGPWQFHMGDDLSWARPDVEDATGHDGWEQIAVDKPWGEQGHPNNGGYGWYRRHISVVSHGGSVDLALNVPSVEDAYQVYWNGALMGGLGRFPPNATYYDFRGRGLMPTHFQLGQARSGILAIRVWRAPPDTDGTPFEGGVVATPVLGTSDGIARYSESLSYEWMRRTQGMLLLNLLYALAAVLALLAWLRDRSQSALFWMTSFCLGNAGIFFGLTYGLQIHRNVQIVIFQLAMGTRDVALWFLLLLLLRLDEKPALVRWLWRLACLQLVLANLDGVVCWVVTSGAAGWLVAAQRLDDFLTIGYTSLEVLPLAIVVYALFRGRRLDPARWLVAAFAFLLEMISITYTAALQGREYTHSKLAERLDAPLFTVFGSAINAQTLAGTLLLLSLIYALYRNSQEVQQRQMAVERELMSAREMQRVLVPEVDLVTPGYVLTSSYKPASEVGGDFFVVLALEDEATLIVLGDVSGKGLKAAMAVSLIVGMVRALGAIFPAPGRLLAEINDRLAGRLQGGFATAIAVRLEPRGDCTMASAGHLSPFVNEREVELPGALPLGIVAGLAYEERRMELMEGDHLAIYTDGLLEARNARGELYGFERLHALFGSRPNAGEVSDVAVSFGQDDDITVLTLTRVGVGDSAAAVHRAPMLSPA